MNRYSLEHLIGKLQNGDVFTEDERQELKRCLDDKKTVLEHSEVVDDLSRIGQLEMQGDEWKSVLRSGFEKIGRTLNADRIRYYDYTFAPRSGEPGLMAEVQWVSEKVRDKMPADSSPVFLTKRKYNRLFEIFASGKSHQARLSDETNGALKILMQADKTRSVLMLPVCNDSTLYGLIRFDSCFDEKTWSSSDITLLNPIIFQFRNLLEKRDLEEQLQNTYRQARIGTWEMNVETGGISWSSITKEIFEVDKDRVPDDELIMQTFYNGNEKDRVLKAVERCQITGEPYDIEVRIKTAKGRVKWVRDTGRAKFKNGKCVRLFGIVQDIDQRKRAEQESEKNKRLLEAITQQTEVAVWVRNDQGEILFVNKQWKSIFGLGEKNVTGLSLHDIFEKKEAEEMIESDRAVIKRSKQVIFEEFLETAIGPRHYMVNKFPLMGIAGLENAVGGIGTDITEIKKTEEHLQETKQKLREIIEHSTNLFYTHNTNHELTYLSPQSIDFLGYPPEEAKRRWTEFVTDHPDNEKGFESSQRAINTGTAQPPFELELIRGDGEKIWVEVNEAPVVKNGKTVSMAGSLTNITKRKTAQRVIHESLREKETLLAEIHHRVKNNLAVVASLMQLQAMESESSEVQGELLESVLRIKSMASIHEQLYRTENFSNIDFANNLEKLVGEVIDTMQSSNGVTLGFDCDEVRLSVNQAIPCSLIVNEVITNVIKHGFSGRETGEIITKLHQKGDEVTISIEDDGIGLPENFDPESTKTLGMQLIKTLTGQISGKYRFESKGKGAIFRLTFDNKSEPAMEV